MSRGNGKAKTSRVGLYLSNNEQFKLQRLATACNKKPATLAHIILSKGLNNAELIRDLQNEYCLYNAYRIIPITINGSKELNFVLSENGRNDF